MPISMIRAQSPQTVVDAGADEQAKADALDRLIGDQVREVSRLKESWHGRSANAAVAKAYRNIQTQYLLHAKLAALARALQSGGAALVADRDVLLVWVDTASSMFDVSTPESSPRVARMTPRRGSPSPRPTPRSSSS